MGRFRSVFTARPCALLIDIQAHVTERTGRHHEIRAVILRVFHIGPAMATAMASSPR